MVMAQTVSGDETEMSDIYRASGGLIVLQQYLGYPLLYTLLPISISQYLDTKRKKYLLIATALFLIRFLFDLRRTVIVITVVYILFLLLIRKRELLYKAISVIKNLRVKLNKKKKIKIAVAVSFFIVVFSWLSAIRGGEESDYSFLQNLYGYYAGSLPYFSQRLALLQNVDYTLGFTSFKGFFSPLFNVLSLLGLPKPELLELAAENVDSLHGTVLEISLLGGGFNSYATCFFEFFLDGGILGVIIISFLFGLYSQRLFLKTKKNKDSRSIWKYSWFVAIFIYLSVLHFNGVVICYIWPFILERIFYRKLSFSHGCR